MNIEIDLKKYNVFFEKESPLAINVKDSKRIANLLHIYEKFENIPDEETVKVIYLEKNMGKFVLGNQKQYELKVNSLNRPNFLKTLTN